MEFVGGDYTTLADKVDTTGASLVIRNCSYFGPIKTDVPTISLVQDIFESGPQREMQEEVIKSSRAVVSNSEFTAEKYGVAAPVQHVIPLPIDFSVFEPGNTMGLQQALSLPDGCVCWIGAQTEIKGWDIFLAIVRQNPDIPFVGVFKDAIPAVVPPNLRAYTRLPTEELVKVIGACRVGLCTSRMESQHLAGIEMGACGLPMVAPPVGTYYERDSLNGQGILVRRPSVENFTQAIRSTFLQSWSSRGIRMYWQGEFDKPVIKAAWTKLVEEVEDA